MLWVWRIQGLWLLLCGNRERTGKKGRDSPVLDKKHVEPCNKKYSQDLT